MQSLDYGMVHRICILDETSELLVVNIRITFKRYYQELTSSLRPKHGLFGCLILVAGSGN